jgi:uncharacterized glyoxalase superfamily protein PhnB
MQLGRTTPILRSFDEQKALEFYVEFLGFKVLFRHRYARPGIEDMPWAAAKCRSTIRSAIA